MGDLDDAILGAAGRSEQDGIGIARQLVRSGQFYQAARCLEITTQRWFGLIPTGQELTGYQLPEFGRFHSRVLALLEAGRCYALARRPRSAEVTVSRALVFVEEALRQAENLSSDDQGSICCVALGFELAGHCALGCRFREGLEYYRASLDYWNRAVRMHPESMPHWTQHPVMETVLNSLAMAGAIQGQDIEPAWDYSTRLEMAMQLLSD